MTSKNSIWAQKFDTKWDVKSETAKLKLRREFTNRNL